MNCLSTLASAALGRVASNEHPDMKARMCAIVATSSDWSSGETLASMQKPLFFRSLAPPRDHVGFVVEPQSAMLAQRFCGGFETIGASHDWPQPFVLDLRDVDRSVPGGE